VEVTLTCNLPMILGVIDIGILSFWIDALAKVLHPDVALLIKVIGKVPDMFLNVHTPLTGLFTLPLAGIEQTTLGTPKS
jgi:hypothetical protein